MTTPLPLLRRGAALAAVVALAACADATGSLPREGAPADLRFSMASYGGDAQVVEMRGDTVVVRWSAWDVSGVDSVKVVPGPERWRAFWAAANEAGVHRWSGSYAAENVVDGTGWSLELRADGRTIRASGSNAYPDRRGRESELQETEAFLQFRQALAGLTANTRS